MEEKNKPGMLKPALNHAMLLGAVMIILTLALYLSGNILNRHASWLTGIVAFAGIIYAVFNYRNQHLGGFISYGHSVGYGVVVGLLVGLITGVFGFILYEFIAPELIDEIRLTAEKEIYRINPDISDAQVDQVLKMQMLLVSSWGMLFSGILGGAFQGLISGLIGGIFAQRKDPDAFEV
jgi:hypothetical protein